MIVCVTGIDSPLGKAIAQRLQQSGIVVEGVPYEQFLMTNDAIVRGMKSMPSADFVVHAAEMSDLFKAEQHPDLAYQVNVSACAAVAEVADLWKAPIVHLSSHLVFDGVKKNPYISANKGRPLSVYGRTKLQSEQWLQENYSKHLILRVGWLLEAGAQGWLQTMLSALSSGKRLNASTDMQLTPVAVDDVARVVDAVIKQLSCNISVWGVYHYAGAEAVTHYELLKAIVLQAFGQEEMLQALIEKKGADVLPGVALPANGALGCIKLRNTFGVKQLPWRRYLPALIEQCQQRGGVKPAENCLEESR
ncbi:dTDP-4-dehydrorhamnose reductase-like protein [Hahella chejuensis KCTC 2396]|uniref:dTDP-4-dehydrorhamnose reductase n=1 Tax=Hahella chejuensis (strain KCTC 2396) TaxID=349521 RepID=Q2SLB0_HAHCH|nr:dTDP-4-dehydrorhamnose reductase-like protein [Hahella chejuensis KCTC 2396]